MKKEFKSLVFILMVILCSSFTVTKVNANYQTFYTDGPPRAGTLPPEITIQTPTNNTYYNTNTILLSFNVSVGNFSSGSAFDSKYLKTISHTLDWQPNSTYLYDGVSGIQEFSDSFNFLDIPDGNHKITVYANEKGLYFDYVSDFMDIYYTSFEINNSITVNFIVDTVLPVVSVLSPENMAYPDYDVNLSCLFNEEIAKTSYSLDGQDNMTFNGDIILTDLQAGDHQLIVYSEDLAGNIGSSETIYFSIEPFPTTLAVASIAIAAVGVGIFVYFKKRRS